METNSGLEKLLLHKLEQYGVVNNENGLIGVLAKQKIIFSYMTEAEIEELFSKVETLYYLKTSSGVNDYILGDGTPEKDIVKFSTSEFKYKVVRLNTDLSKYKHDICISYFYHEPIENDAPLYIWKGVFINSLENIYNNNFGVKVDKYKPQEDKAPFNRIKGLDNIKIIETKSTEMNLANTTNATDKNISKEYPTTDIYEKLYTKLNEIEEWGSNKETATNNIKSYISYLSEAVFSKLNNETLENDCYKLTEANNITYLIINSKLLGKYSEWIYLLYTVKKRANHLTQKIECLSYGCQIIENNYDLVDKGIFNINMSDIKPIKLYKDKSSLIFNAEIDEFEIEITSRNFKHIIEERKDRLPIALQNQSVMEIAYRIRGCIEYAIKMSKIDYNYVVPCYGTERDEIQYMIPLFDSFDFNNKVQSVLVFNKLGGKYIVNTVLKVEDAFKMARVLNKPSAKWLV